MNMFMNPKNRAKRARRRRISNHHTINFFVIVILFFVGFWLFGTFLGRTGHQIYDFVGTTESGLTVQFGKAYSNEGPPDPVCPEIFDNERIIECASVLWSE